MKIELATVEDVAGILALEREMVNAPHWGEAAYRMAILGGDGGLRRCLWVARLESEIVGFAVGSVVVGTAELETVAVRASARRQGLGRALCAAVIAWAWWQEADTLALEVRAGSAGARALYAGLGFVECGRRRAYYSDPVEDAVLMRLQRDRKGAAEVACEEDR